MTPSSAALATISSELTAWFVEMYDDLTALAENTEKSIVRARGKRSSLAEKDLKAVPGPNNVIDAQIRVLLGHLVEGIQKHAVRQLR